MGALPSKKPPKEVIVSSYNENMAHTWGEGKGISIFSRDGDKALKLEKEIEIPDGNKKKERKCFIYGTQFFHRP